MAYALRSGAKKWFGTDCRSGRFCGLPLEVETPDHSSIWRFRQTIHKLSLSAALLAETNRQLDALGHSVKRAPLADATLIAASVKRPPGSARSIGTHASRWPCDIPMIRPWPV